MNRTFVKRWTSFTGFLLIIVLSLPGAAIAQRSFERIVVFGTTCPIRAMLSYE
jgi:hypothetical protein